MVTIMRLLFVLFKVICYILIGKILLQQLFHSNDLLMNQIITTTTVTIQDGNADINHHQDDYTLLQQFRNLQLLNNINNTTNNNNNDKHATVNKLQTYIKNICNPNHTEIPSISSSSKAILVKDQCYKDRFHGYWDDVLQTLQSFDPICNQNFKTYIHESVAAAVVQQQQQVKSHYDILSSSTTIESTTAAVSSSTTTTTKTEAVSSNVNTKSYYINDKLFDVLDNTCILLFGDSTDRQIIEHWCPRFMMNDDTQGIRNKLNSIELWMPDHIRTSLSKQSQIVLSLKERKSIIRQLKQSNGGIRCTVPNHQFTIGSYVHYGVGEPPYWKFAHMYMNMTTTNNNNNNNMNRIIQEQLDWGNTTYDRIINDVPKFFQQCNQEKHNNNNNHTNIIVVQSYLWDLAKQWHVHGTERPPYSMIIAWSHNVTRMIRTIRTVLEPYNVHIGWRFGGPIISNHGRDTQAIYDMNEALMAIPSFLDEIDFVADYGAILSSSLAYVHNHGPFPTHPPPMPMTTYFNLLLNAIIAIKYNTTTISET